MKTNYIGLILIALMLFTAACDDKFQEINTNPNAVTEIDDKYIFANAVLKTFRGDNEKFIQFPFGAQYAHIYTGRNNAMFIDRYYDYFESVEYQYAFEGFYFDPIRLVEEVKRVTRQGGKAENEVRHAMAQVLAAVNYARLADTFGSVPYEQGGLGQTGILYPEYNSVEYIYKALMDQLKAATAVLATADAAQGYPNADPLYNNDLKKWSRFANSLRLRLAMRARFAAPDYCEDVIAECLSNPLITENDQNAKNENQDSDIGEFSNPIYIHYSYWQWRMSELFIETLKTDSDPRLAIFARPNKDGEYVGIPNGLSDAYLTKWDWDNVSAPADILVGKAAPTYQMAAAEIWLLRAEAALFGLDDDDANLFYQTGIRKSFEQWGVPGDQIDAWFANSNNATLSGSQEEKLRQISTQMWIAFMSNPVEAWSNMRRTAYPQVEKRTAPRFALGVTNGVLPRRLKYPASEVNINHANYLKAIEQQGPDEITTPLWWDVR